MLERVIIINFLTKVTDSSSVLISVGKKWFQSDSCEQMYQLSIMAAFMLWRVRKSNLRLILCPIHAGSLLPTCWANWNRGDWCSHTSQYKIISKTVKIFGRIEAFGYSLAAGFYPPTYCSCYCFELQPGCSSWLLSKAKQGSWLLSNALTSCSQLLAHTPMALSSISRPSSRFLNLSSSRLPIYKESMSALCVEKSALYPF